MGVYFPPRAHLTISGDIFGCHNWHLGGPGQGWCSTFHNAQDGPHNENYPVPCADIAGVEKSLVSPRAGILTNVLLRWRVSERTTSVSQFLTLRKRGHLEGLPFFVGDCFPEAGGWRREWRCILGTGRLSPLGWEEVVFFLESAPSHRLSVTLWGGHVQGAWDLVPLPGQKEVPWKNVSRSVLGRGVRSSEAGLSGL